jgi:lipopolysaccharide export LptBFGC system permease protein LptF
MALSYYLLTRAGGRFLLLLAVFVGIIAGGQIAITIGKGVSPEALTPVLAGMVLFSLPIALPLALTTAVLVTVGAMNRDGELRALAACGIGEVTVVAKLWPLVVAGVIASAALSHIVLPEAMGTIRANKGRFYQAGIAYRVAAQKPILNEQGASAWARSAAGRALEDVYLTHADGEVDTTLHAAQARWFLARTGAQDGLGIELRDVRAVRRFSDGRIVTAETPSAQYAVLDQTPEEDQLDDPDAQSTARVIDIIEAWTPAQKRHAFNNARLTLHLRLYTPIALVVFALFAAGLALILPTSDNLFGLIIVVLIVAGSTVPAVLFVKSSIDHPQMHPAILLWPPAGVLLGLGLTMLLRPDRSRELAARPLGALAGAVAATRRRIPLERLRRWVRIRSFRLLFARREGAIERSAEPVARAITARGLKTIDRFILQRALTRWIGVLFIGVFLIILGDFVGKMGQYLRAAATDPLLYAEYLLCRLPEFTALWLPLSALTASMLVAGPMLRQGTIMMLSSSGIAPRRVFLALIPFAALVGLLGLGLHDQVVPRSSPRADDLEEEMGARSRAQRPGKQKQVKTGQPAGWRSGEVFWSARSAQPNRGEYEAVAAFDAPHGTTLVADRLTFVDGAWRLDGAVVLRATGQTRFAHCTPTEAGIDLPIGRRQLALQLRPEHAKTSDQLLAAPTARTWPIIVSRLLAGLTPVLCLLFALPRFTRWENRHRIGANTAWTLIQALVPLVAVAAAGRVITATSENPVLIGAALGSVMLVLGAWRWAIMRV